MFTNNLLDIFITFPVTNCESGQREEKLKLKFSRMSNRKHFSSEAGQFYKQENNQIFFVQVNDSTPSLTLNSSS